MVVKKRSDHVKVGKLKLKRETVKDLTTEEKKKVKGGVFKKPVTLAPTNTAGCTAPTVCT